MDQYQAALLQLVSLIVNDRPMPVRIRLHTVSALADMADNPAVFLGNGLTVLRRLLAHHYRLPIDLQLEETVSAAIKALG